MADFTITHHGSISLLTPNTMLAEQWVADHLPEDCMKWGRNSNVIEPRYLAPILDGIAEAGFSFGP
jgi:hypothetical protein